jgi:hypothetical protein
VSGAPPASRVVLFLLVGGGVGAAKGAGAQVVRGEVTALGSAAPVAYATVSLQPAFGPRFADAGGRFRFEPVPAGDYRLVVRLIGYMPYNAPLVVPDSGVAIRVALQPLLITLPPVTVTGRARCTAPGRPDPAAQPELVSLFDQLRENAARFRLLSDTYPFRYWVARYFEDEAGDGAIRAVRSDTVEYRSNQRGDAYAPGRVVRIERGAERRERIMHLPTLADLADSTFQSTHCFRYAGVDTVGGVAYLRLDFRVADHVRTPDVDGTAYLDLGTRVLHRLTLSLTRAEQAALNVRSVSAEATFGELAPTLLVLDRLDAVTTLRRARGLPVRRLERQRLLRVEFVGPSPR